MCFFGPDTVETRDLQGYKILLLAKLEELSASRGKAETVWYQGQATGRVIALTKPILTPKRSFRFGCIRLTVVSCVRSRRHWSG